MTWDTFYVKYTVLLFYCLLNVYVLVDVGSSLNVEAPECIPV